MKRYMPTIKLVGFELTQRVAMKEFEGGDYVRYEDMKNMLARFVKGIGITINPETFSKELIKNWE